MAASMEKRCTAADEKAYLDMAQELLMSSPPVMAYVPDRWPNGRAKYVCGWQVGCLGTFSTCVYGSPSFRQKMRMHCRSRALNQPPISRFQDTFFDGKTVFCELKRRQISRYFALLLAALSDRLLVYRCVCVRSKRFCKQSWPFPCNPGRFAAGESTLQR